MELGRVFEQIDARRERVIAILRELIAVDTTIPPGSNYDRMVEVLEGYLQPLGFDCRRVEMPEEAVKRIPLSLEGARINLVASREEGRPPLSIYAHMDVVPVEGDWKHDPFGGEVEGDVIYGRGTLDMKGDIAAALLALECMRELQLESLFDIHALMCCDEEVGYYPGVRYLAEQGFIRGPLLWLEGGGQVPFQLKATAGSLVVEITTVGMSCHSGINYLGVNAVEEMVPILDELKALKAEEEAFRSRYPAYPHPDAPCDRMTPMFNLNIIEGGIKTNIVPAECRLILDRRYLPDEDLEAVKLRIRKALDRGRERSKALEVRADFRHIYRPVVMDEDSPGNVKARKALMEVHGFGEEFPLVGIAGSTDMGDVQEVQPDIELIGMGAFSPLTLDKAHAVDECVGINDLLALAKQIVYFLTVP
jgi:succinyl-diaminopimelate desuccinylase